MSHAMIPSKPTPKPVSTRPGRPADAPEPRVPGLGATAFGR
jgi:hypothetical protein